MKAPHRMFVVRKGDGIRLANCMEYLGECFDAGMDTEVLVYEWSDKRSKPQHKYFWGLCGYVAFCMREAGMAVASETVHDAILGDIYGWRDSGFGVMKPARTLTFPDQMKNIEMIDVLNRMPEWAGRELGIRLPADNDPEEVWATAQLVMLSA